MRAHATFTVSDWTPAEAPAGVGEHALVETAAPIGLAHMVKTFEGELSGHATTWFLGALNHEAGSGTYVAMEAFDGTLAGRRGTFALAHGASTHGEDRFDEYFAIVPGSGTGELAGITGGGSLSIDADGTHRVVMEYDVT